MPSPIPKAGLDLTAAELQQYGLLIDAANATVNELTFESPVYVHGHRLRFCTMGAFALYNAAGLASAYRCRIGRYAQLGESTIIGPPEHPMDWFSTHPFAFTRPAHMPNMYQLEDFARLAPDADAGPSWADGQPLYTDIGHEAYVGAGSFVKRGVRIGIGAVVGARSVVTRDVPDYAIVAGAPARVLRMRLDDALVERMLRLEWWRYDLAPYKQRVDYRRIADTLSFYEDELAAGRLQPLKPRTYLVRHAQGRFSIEPAAQGLYA